MAVEVLEMKIKMVAVLLTALLLIPAGFMLAEDTEVLPPGIEEAAEEMDLNLEQAREILEQAREQRMRNQAHRHNVSKEEALQLREQRREEMQARLEQRQEDFLQRMEQKRQMLQQRIEQLNELNIRRMLPGCPHWLGDVD